MEFVSEVKDYIEHELAGAKASLELASGGRVFGRVLWENFEDIDDMERPQYLWKRLRNHFRARAAEIGVILVYTPHELAVMQGA